MGVARLSPSRAKSEDERRNVEFFAHKDRKRPFSEQKMECRKSKMNLNRLDVDVGNGGADGEAEGGDEADGDVAEQAAVWADDVDEQAFVATEGAAGDAHAAAGAPCGAVEGEEFHRVAEQADGAAEAVHFCVGNDGGGGVDGVEARHASEPMGERFCFRCAGPQEDDASDCGARFEGHALADAARNFD